MRLMVGHWVWRHSSVSHLSQRPVGDVGMRVQTGAEKPMVVEQVETVRCVFRRDEGMGGAGGVWAWVIGENQSLLCVEEVVQANRVSHGCGEASRPLHIPSDATKNKLRISISEPRKCWAE